MPEHYGIWMKEAAMSVKKKKKYVVVSYTLGNVSSLVKLSAFVPIHVEYIAVSSA